MTRDDSAPSGLFRNLLDRALAAQAPVQMQIGIGSGENASGQRVPLVLVVMPGRPQPVPFGLDECRGLALQLLEASVRAQIALEAEPSTSPLIRP